jgi:hypothetical protein
MRVALVTCAAVPDGWDDDRPVAEWLGADVCTWDDPDVDWDRYDRVVLRSVWDYTDRLDDFLAWCTRIGPRRLRNPPDLVAFNADKRYLAELSVPTVPTTYVAPGQAMPHLDGEVVVKPNVSAGARDTGRFGPATHAEAGALIRSIHASGRCALLQPYLASVDTHGETALVYLGGELSHVLHKRPVLRPDEVAPVHEVNGLTVAAAMLDEDLVGAGAAGPAQRALGARVIAEITARFGPPLYARADIVCGPGGEPVLMELEAIEPALYLATAPGSAARFADAIRRG